jgi:thiol:disulfide interchange protein
MRAVFSLVSSISALTGVIMLLTAVFLTWDLLSLVSALVALLDSYAWSLVGSMWERLERVERKQSNI